MNEIEGMLRKIDENITTKLVKLDPDSFTESTELLAEILERQDGRILLNIGGGDRALLISLYTAAMAADAEIETTTLLSDVIRNSQEIELPELRPPFKDADRLILKRVVEDGCTTNKELSENTERSKGSISRCVNRLRESSYVEVVSDGREKRIQPTLYGKIVTNN